MWFKKKGVKTNQDQASENTGVPLGAEASIPTTVTAELATGRLENSNGPDREHPQARHRGKPRY